MSEDTPKRRLERIIYLVAAIAGIAGVAFWIWEWPDREEERDARQSELVARANQILKDAGATGSISNADDPTIGWAIQTLVKYRHPVILNADHVTLAQLNADCASISIKARSLMIMGGHFSNAQIEWDGDTFHAIQLEATNVTFAAHGLQTKADISMSTLTNTNFAYGDFTSPSTALEMTLRSTSAENVWVAPDLRFAINMGLVSPDKPTDTTICRLNDGKIEGALQANANCSVSTDEQSAYKVRMIKGWVEACEPPYISGPTIPKSLMPGKDLPTPTKENVATSPSGADIAASRGDGDDLLEQNRTAADKGDANAQFLVGASFESGQGTSLDYAEAVRWYRLAAEQGHPRAQYNLGVLISTGRGATVDKAGALEWYRLAADQGHAMAQHNLGVAFEQGLGAPRDEIEAVRWYRLAADQGLAGSQYNLGTMYAAGKGVRLDQTEAARWYRLAADQGQVDAQFNLGVRYANGDGVPKSTVDAYQWWSIAAEAGDVQATKNLIVLQKVMTSSDIAKGQSLAKEWRAVGTQAKQN